MDLDARRSLEVLQPGGITSRHAVGGRPAAAPAGEIIARSVKPLPQEEWLPVKGKPGRSVGFDVECTVSVPADCCRARVLLLVQFPSRQHAPGRCSATVNGQAAQLEERSSEGQMGYAGGTHGFNPQSYWAGIIP